MRMDKEIALTAIVLIFLAGIYPGCSERKSEPAVFNDLTITVVGIETTGDKTRITKIVREVPGVKSVEELKFNQGSRLLELAVSFKGSGTAFKESFYEACLLVPEFKGIEEFRSSGNRTDYRLP